MKTVIEFIGEEPMENLITSLNFKMERAVMIGRSSVIDELGDRTRRILEKYCGIESTDFYKVDEENLDAVKARVREIIEAEIADGNEIYFDMTGGENVILTAFGMVADDYDTPMHVFDVEEDHIVDLGGSSDRSIFHDVEERKVEITPDLMVEMHGGRINYGLHKDTKAIDDEEFAKDVAKLWSVEEKFKEEWNLLSIFLREHMMPERSLHASVETEKARSALANMGKAMNTLAELDRLLDALAEEGLITDLHRDGGYYNFSYKSQGVKECLRDGGSTLELYTYARERKEADYCMVGVHLDWDGVIHETSGIDVYNEIDVFSIKGNVPKFISCKTGKMSPSNTLHALYELNTVATRFGGKYARKVLVTSRPVADVYKTRALEMGIEVEE